MTFLRFIKKHHVVLLLVGILVVAAGIRFTNIQHTTNVDEPNIIKRAVLIADGQHHIQWYNWPAQSLMRISAAPYKVMGTVLNIKNNTSQDVQYWYEQNKQPFNTIGHIITALFGIATVYLLFLIGRLLRGPYTGLFAAGILSVGYMHVLHSRFMTPDVPMTAALVLNIYLAIILFRFKVNKKNARTEMWLYACSAAIWGFAIATKYTGIVVGVPLLLAHAGRMAHVYLPQVTWRSVGMWLVKLVWNKYTLVALAAGTITHTVFHPFFFVDFQLIMKDMLFEVTGNRIGKDWATEGNVFWKNVVYYLKGSLGWNGTVYSLVAFGTLLYSLIRIHKKQWTELAGIAIIFATLLFLLGSHPLHWSRWSVPLAPLIAIAAAIGFRDLWAQLKRRMPKRWNTASLVLASIFIIVIALPQLLVTVAQTRSITLDGKVAAMAEYIRAEVPEGATIVSDSYSLPVGPAYTVKANSFHIYKTSVAQYQKENVEYLLVRPFRLKYAKKQPELYQYIITFFTDLKSNGEFVYKTKNGCDSILSHKRDHGVYQYIAQHGLGSVWSPCKKGGDPLSLYKLN